MRRLKRAHCACEEREIAIWRWHCERPFSSIVQTGCELPKRVLFRVGLSLELQRKAQTPVVRVECVALGIRPKRLVDERW